MDKTNSTNSGSGWFEVPMPSLGNQYLGNPRLPQEIHLIIARHLCPHCCIGSDVFLSTEDARMLQYGLGSLAAASRYLRQVANEHRFHSFIQPFRPNIRLVGLLHRFRSDQDVEMAALFQTRALPEFLERLIQHEHLSQDLRYLSIRNLTMTYKAGITKRRLQLLIDSSLVHEIQPPYFVPVLLNQPVTDVNSLPSLDGFAFWVDDELWLNDSGAGGVGDGTSKMFDAWLVELLLFGLAPRLEKLLIDGEIAEEVFRGRSPLATTFPAVRSLLVPNSQGDQRDDDSGDHFRTEEFLLNFPNLHTFQNHDYALILDPVRQLPGQPLTLFPNLRKLTLAAVQPGRLEHVTQILWAFPRLEELVYHRTPSVSIPSISTIPGFSNANVFDGVHHCLRKLTYSSTEVSLYSAMPYFYGIKVNFYEQRRFSDVPHFANFELLEDLTIDQGLLGPLSPTPEHGETELGPEFPELSWDLPQSLRRLTIQFVYDRAQIAAQLRSVALAKTKHCQFPYLRDIYLTFVEEGTHTLTEDWVPEIPLPPTDHTIEVAREMLLEAGIFLWTVPGKIKPPPGEPEEHKPEKYPEGVIPAGTMIKIFVKHFFFRET